MARMLLVEDDPLLINQMKPHLEDLGHSIQLATDAAEAMAALAADDPFDLVILDVMLPLRGAFDDGTGGLEAGIEILRRIRENDDLRHRRELPVLCYTVRGVTPRIRDALQNLSGVVIAKGGDPAEMLETIDTMLAGERGPQQ